MEFVDIHCHALFRVDDGAKNEEMMKNMLRAAYEDGTRYLCFTPHFKIHEFDDENEVIEQKKRLDRRFKVALTYAEENLPDFKLFLGNEVMYHNGADESLYTKKCNFLGDSSFALIEFSPNSSGFEIENAVIRLLRKGIRPVIAHVERYSAFVKDLELISSLHESGALLQVNAGSITEFKHGKTARFLKRIFKKHLVDIVASDAHDDSDFPPCLSNAYSSIVKRYGNDYADKIFHLTPLSVLLNEKNI